MSDDASPAISPNPRVSHLLAVAREVFASQGYQHVSIDAIARKAGVSKETIYRHFDDKAALFTAALNLSRDAFSAQLAQAAAADPSGDGAVRDYADAIYASAADGGFLTATWLAITNVERFPEIASELNLGTAARLAPIREALAARPDVVARAPVTLDHAGDLGAMTVEGPRHLMGWPWLCDERRRRHVDATVSLFLRGCAAGRVVGPIAAEPPEPVLSPAAVPQGDHIATLMKTAYTHFVSQGYGGVNLDMIGAQARVGRGTLYRHFGGKSGLFEAVVMEEARAIGADAVQLPALAVNAEPFETLLPFVRAVNAALAGPRSIALHRLVIAEARRAPRLARQVYAATRLSFMLPLTTYLAGAASSGRLHLQDEDWHARQLLTLAVQGNRPLSHAALASAGEREAVARRAVMTFLHGFSASLECA